MIKKLQRIALICLLICQFVTKASAQTTTQHYAVNGTANINLIHSVYWLTWGGGTGTTFPASPATGQPFSPFNITNGTYVWNYSPTVRITAVISNEVINTAHGENVTAYTPGTYFGNTNTGEIGDGLNILYSGNGVASAQDPANPSQNLDKGVPQSGLSISNGTATFDIAITVEILVGSTWTLVNYPGMVIGDAESIDPTEYISSHTNGTDGWQLLNARTQGTASDANYVMDFSTTNSVVGGITTPGAIGSDFKLHTINGVGNIGVQAVMFAHGVHSLTNLSMFGSGTTALAIGFVLPFDLGDAPVGFGNPTSYINNFVIQPHLPTNGTFPVATYTQTTLVPKANVFIGAQNVDADGEPINSTLANQDDLTNNPDEDGLPTTSSIVNGITLKVNQSSDVVLTVPAANLLADDGSNLNVNATLYGWLDFNGDGIFSANEMVSVPVPAGTPQGTNFTLTFPNASFTNNIKAGPLFGRFRITTTDLSTTDNVATTVDERSTAATLDGEIEDYKFNDILGVNISGTVVDDGNGSTDSHIASTVSGQNGIQFVAGQQLYAYLLSTGPTPVVLAKAVIAADGTYSFTNQNNGNYTVAISTNNVAVGAAQSAVSANLPANYVPSGSTFGLNNAGGSGFGAASMQINANTTNNSLDITGLNFGVNQAPVTVADATTTPPSTPVNITVTNNDSDADGSLNLTTVLLTNPADNTTNNTNVTLANKGTYTVNTTTGVVTFTPLTGFAGSAIINYTVKDNFGTVSLPATITVTIKPSGVADAVTTNIQTPVTTNVKANDGASATGTTVIIAGNTAANLQHGAVVANADNTVTYTPVATFIGTDTYTYELQSADGTIQSDPVTVTVTILPAGQPDAAQTLTNTPVTIPIESNDGTPSTANGAAVVALTHPANGTATLNGTSVVYTPVAGFTGTDTFSYTLTTGGLTSNPILVTVTVLSANASMSITKVANNTVSTVGGIINYTITVKNTSNIVLTNIVVTDNGATNLTPTSVPSLGIGASTTFTAQHAVTQADFNAGFYDNQASVTANDPNGSPVTNPGSDDPTTPAANDPTRSIISPPGQVSLTKTGVYNNGTGIVYTFTVKNTGTVKLTNVTISDPTLNITNAAVTIPAGGLLAGQSATLTATYTVTQADRVAATKSNTATVNSTDPSGNNTTAQGSTTTALPALLVANNDAAVTQMNTPASVSVLTNDTPDNSPFDLSTVTVVTAPAHGTATTNPNGTITYTPTNGYSGTDSFTYTVKDQNGYTSNTATVSLNVNNFVASMSLTKVANNGATNVGDIINYTITVANTGNALLTNVVVTDANATNISPAVISSLAAGSSTTVTAQHTVTSADVVAHTVSNQANVTAKDPNGNPVTGPPSDDPATPAINDPTVTTLATIGTISLVKTAVVTGNVITYTFTVKNTGTVTLNTVTITDARIGLNGAVVNVPAGGLTAGSTAALTVPYTLTQADKDAGTITNTATVSSRDPSNDVVTNSSSIITTFPKSPTAVNDATTAGFNTPVTVSVLSNDNPNGSTFNTGSVQIITAPAHGTAIPNANGTVTYTPTTGYTGSDSFTYKVADANGYYTNVATVNVTVSTFSAAMTLTKVANNAVSVAGDVINYTITVTNTGNANLTNVRVTDANADAGSVTPAIISTLPVGNFATVAAKHTVTAADVTAGSVSNQAGVTATDPGNNTINGPFSDNPATPAPNDPTISLISTPGTVSIAEAGVLSGNIINYTFTIKNTGTVTLTNVTLTDAFLGMTNTAVTTVPAGGLTAGSTVTFTRQYTLTQADKNAGTVTSPVTVNAKDPGNNTVTNNATTTTSVPKDVANNDVATANFNTPATIAVLTNDSPGNSTFDPTTVQVVSQPTHGTVVTNADGTITYTPNTNYTGADSFTYQVQDQFGYSTNVATVNVTVASFTASMTLTKVANNGAGNVGDVINYTITVTNTGTAALTNVTVTDANADAGSVTPAVTATLAAGASATIAAKHTVTAADVTAGSVSNQANVTAKDPNGNPVTGPPSDNPTTPAPNDPTVTTIIPGTGTITLTKTGIFSGNAISYTFTIKNTGTLALTNITLTDANVGLSNTVVAANLAAGATTTYTANYILTQADKDAGTVTNNATVTSKDPGGNPVTANGSVIIPVTKSPTATADATTTGIGQPVIIPVLSNDNSGNTTFNVASVQIVTQPAHGTAVANTDGSVTYTPNAGYSGSDSFTYKVADSYGYFTNVAPVTINISAPGSISLTKTGVYTNTTITYTFTVKNTGPVVLTAITITDAKVGLTAAAVTLPIGGLISGATATLTATYTVTQTDKDQGSVTNTATTSGKDPIGNTVVNTATVTTTIPKSPVAVNETPTGLPGQPVIITVIKDGLPDNVPFDPTSIQIVTQPQHGTVKVNNDGTITYVPDAGYTGQDSFSYRMKDANGYYTNIATVTVSVVSTVDLKIPTLFTPNGDGVNDTFEIRGLAKYPNNEVIIINRWGNEVFKQTNYQNKWAGDGLNEGTYYYLLYVKNADGSVFQVLKGWITLLRSTNK